MDCCQTKFTWNDKQSDTFELPSPLPPNVCHTKLTAFAKQRLINLKCTQFIFIVFLHLFAQYIYI